MRASARKHRHLYISTTKPLNTPPHNPTSAFYTPETTPLSSGVGKVHDLCEIGRCRPEDSSWIGTLTNRNDSSRLIIPGSPAIMYHPMQCSDGGSDPLPSRTAFVGMAQGIISVKFPLTTRPSEVNNGGQSWIRAPGKRQPRYKILC